MPEKKLLPTIGIRDICASLKAETFSIFRHEENGKPSLPKPHKHNFFMLLLIAKGSGAHSIDFSTYRAKSQQVHFLAPGQAHSWELHPQTTGFQLLFSAGFLEHMPQQWPFFSFGADPVLQLTREQFAGILHETEQINQEFTNADNLSVRIISDRLRVLLGLLERYYEAAHPSVNHQPARRLMKEFQSLLELHYRENASVEFYADLLHITPQYLNIVCKKGTGITAGHTIRNRLVLEAKRMLTLTGQDVKEITYSLGFSDTSYFSRFFRRSTGQTPIEFRNENRKGQFT